MKKIIFLFIAISIFGCSSNDDDCQENKDAINLKYDTQVQYVRDNPGPGGVDYRQISLLEVERNKKLSEACN